MRQDFPLGLCQVHPPSSPHGQQEPSNPNFTPTLCAAVCITLWLSSCFSFENVQWSAATEREGLSLFFPGKSENVEGTGERAQKGL